MADRVIVVPAELREAARTHRDLAERLSAAGSDHAAIMASLESLGPVFAELRDAGRDLLAERQACYDQQAAGHADLADRLAAAADTWESQDAEAAARLREVTGEGR